MFLISPSCDGPLDPCGGPMTLDWDFHSLGGRSRCELDRGLRRLELERSSGSVRAIAAGQLASGFTKKCVFKCSVHFFGVQPYRREDCLRWRMMTNIFFSDMFQPPTSARALLSLNLRKLYRLPNLLIDSSTQNPAVVWSNLHAVLCNILFR